jgi:preprotein translocase YajC subunit
MFYFLVMRPQQKREAKNQKLRNSTKKGDRIITAGGIIGTIHKIVSDREVSLEIAENVRMRILKSSIAEVLTKGSDLAAPIHDEIEHGVSSGSNGKGTVAVVAPDTENSAKRGSTKRRT